MEADKASFIKLSDMLAVKEKDEQDLNMRRNCYGASGKIHAQCKGTGWAPREPFTWRLRKLA
jgi:hypothetical protein